MDPIFFASASEFRSWLERHHESQRELWVGFHKKRTGRASLTWEESVDEALCFGWIDGVRRSVDSDRYMIRFTPRKAGSVWSNLNTRGAEELIRPGLMRPAGQRAFQARAVEGEVLARWREHEEDDSLRFRQRVVVASGQR